MAADDFVHGVALVVSDALAGHALEEVLSTGFGVLEVFLKALDFSGVDGARDGDAA